MDAHLETPLNLPPEGDAAFWVARYRQQVRWTNTTRRYLFERLGIQPGASILEVGCGAGAVLGTLHADGYSRLTGLDIDLSYLLLAEPSHPLLCGDGQTLPFKSDCFDAAICHFLLLWVVNPKVVLTEMARVIRPGGFAVILAEPDYGGRLDSPPPLDQLGRLQTEAIQAQGADPFIGRKLKEILILSGYAQVHAGLIGAEWPPAVDACEHELEWQVLEKDLAGRLPEIELQWYRRLDEQAWRVGTRILHVPICYAWGQVVEDQVLDRKNMMV